MASQRKTALAIGAVLLLAAVGLLLTRGRRPAAPTREAGHAVVVKTAPATRGRLAQSLLLSGTLQPVQRVELSAQLPAKVVAVLVKEGQTVPAGSVIARLDDREMVSQIAKARAGVAVAAANVTKARLGREISGQLANARVDKAQGGRRAAEAQVAAARAGADLSAKSAGAGVSQALSGIEAAEAALAQAERGAALSRQQADADIAAARAGVAAALADVKRAASGGTVASDAARADVERAQAGLHTAEANLARVKAGARTGEVEAAEAQVRQARIGRDAAKQAVSDLEYLFQHGGVSGADLAQARTQLQLAQAQVEAAEATARNAKAGATAEEVAAAESQVREAQAGVKAAEAGLGRDRVSAAEVAAAQTNVDRAQTGLATAQQAQAERYALAEAQVKAARAAVAQARAGHEAAVAGLGQSGVRQAEVSAAQGNADMASAGVREASVGRREAEVQAVDLAAAQAGLMAAQADYRLAAEQLDKCRILSPVGGQVTKLSIHAGDTIMPGMPVATVETEAAAELVCLAAGSQRAQLAPGQRASVSVEGLPQPCVGTVRDVATSAESDGRTFKVRLIVSGQALPPGAQAAATVDVATEEHALTVPATAVVDLDGANPHVFVALGGRAVRRVVTLGLRGATAVQVLEGVTDGEPVVVEGAEGLRDGLPVEQPSAR